MSPAVIVTIILVVGIALVIAATLADRRSAARLMASSVAVSVRAMGRNGTQDRFPLGVVE